MLIVPLSVLVACSDSIGSVEPPDLAPAPEELTVLCEQPVLLPERILTQEEVENYWVQDRSNLMRCGQYKELLEEFYVDRDQKIGGEQNG